MASKRQDKIYATDALLNNLKEASHLNQIIPNPQVQYEQFRKRRIDHQQSIMAQQSINFDRMSTDPFLTSSMFLLDQTNPYNQSNTASISKRSKNAMRPYDQVRYQNKMGQPSITYSHRSRRDTEEPPLVN